MTNRYGSINAGIAAGVIAEVKVLRPKLPDAYWKAKDGSLIAVINGEELELTFEEGDPITDVLLLFLNNMRPIISTLEQP